MKVALISDSHGSLDRLEECLQHLESGGVTEIIHAGDFALGEITKVLEKFPKLNFKIALGNCDVNEEILDEVKSLPNVELGEILEFELGGKRFAVTHKIQDLRGSAAEILISGHTHIPQVKKVGEKLFLNPGSLMGDGGYFLLDLENLNVERKLFNKKIG
jgi:uncharacterized protein